MRGRKSTSKSFYQLFSKTGIDHREINKRIKKKKIFIEFSQIFILFSFVSQKI